MFYLVLHYFIFLQSGVYEVWRLVQCFRAKKTLILQTAMARPGLLHLGHALGVGIV